MYFGSRAATHGLIVHAPSKYLELLYRHSKSVTHKQKQIYYCIDGGCELIRLFIEVNGFEMKNEGPYNGVQYVDASINDKDR